MRYFSMFSGIGGFELGIQQAFDGKSAGRFGQEESVSESDSTDTSSQPNERQYPSCVGYSEIDKYAIKVYERHYGQNSRMARERECDCSTQRRQKTLNGERTGLSQINGDMHHDTNCSYTKSDNNGGHKNYGDATTINPTELPDFDLLVGGFPCQAFSIAGKRAGFNDTRGTLFFDIARILAEKRPRHLVLENVKGLLSHDSGKTFQTILGVLSDLGYRVEWQVLNSKDFGVPQNRERIYFVGHLRGECSGEVFPISNTHGQNTKSVQRHISNTLTSRYEAAQATGTYIGESKLNAQKVRSAATRTRAYAGKPETLEIRKDELSNTINSVTKDYYATDMARIRRLTPKECERLQGFPDNWTAGESDTQRYKMAGNAVTTNVVEAVITNLIKHLDD